MMVREGPDNGPCVKRPRAAKEFTARQLFLYTFLALAIGIACGILMMFSVTIADMAKYQREQQQRAEAQTRRMVCREHFKACAACADMIEADGGIR